MKGIVIYWVQRKAFVLSKDDEGQPMVFDSDHLAEKAAEQNVLLFNGADTVLYVEEDGSLYQFK